MKTERYVTSLVCLIPGSNNHHFANIVLESGELRYVDSESNASVWPGKEKGLRVCRRGLVYQYFLCVGTHTSDNLRSISSVAYNSYV